VNRYTAARYPGNTQCLTGFVIARNGNVILIDENDVRPDGGQPMKVRG
jgi:hypothetical protein